MAKIDRRQRISLDEAYQYYNALENGQETPELYKLVKAVTTLSFALMFLEANEFKLTRQLWKRLYQALFDRLLINFAGTMVISNETLEPLDKKSCWPETGYLEFHPDLCRRTEDIHKIELSKLYPKTYKILLSQWEQGNTYITPILFPTSDCEDGVCYMKPMVLGSEILSEESQQGKKDAYYQWWDLYWQAYCTRSQRKQEIIFKQMYKLQIVWGNLYY